MRQQFRDFALVQMCNPLGCLHDCTNCGPDPATCKSGKLHNVARLHERDGRGRKVASRPRASIPLKRPLLARRPGYIAQGAAPSLSLEGSY